MASSPDDSEAKRLLEKLKKRPVIPIYTQAQIDTFLHIQEAKKLWTRALNMRRKEAKLYDFDYKDRRPCRHPFRFLDLPGELRNKIYEIYLDDFKNEPGNVPNKLQYSPELTDRQIQYEAGERRHLMLIRQNIFRSLDKQFPHPVMATNIKLQFDRYRIEHGALEKVYCDPGDYFFAVVINPRGNISCKLPPLTLTCRKTFKETLALFYEAGWKGLQVVAYVRKLDFFPLLRFIQMMGSERIGLPIQPKNIVVRLLPVRGGEKDAIHEGRFSAIKRMLELHWLRRLPLWECLTDVGDADDVRHCFKPLGDFFTSVRHVVALFRADYLKWKLLSTEYLHLYSLMNDNAFSIAYWSGKSGSELVEAITNSLSTAIEYRLGYQGNFSWKSCTHSPTHDMCPSFTGAEVDGKIAREKEHSVVHVTTRYLRQVHIALRCKLGHEYKAWDKFSKEEEPMPPSRLTL